jgi:hypothetical protein
LAATFENREIEKVGRNFLYDAFKNVKKLMEKGSLATPETAAGNVVKFEKAAAL